MPSTLAVETLVSHLEDAGAVHLDARLRDLLRPEGVGLVDPTDPMADSAFAASGHVLITRGSGAAIREIRTVAESLRATLNSRTGGGH